MQIPVLYKFRKKHVGTRYITKLCRRCLGTKCLTRSGRPIRFVTCPRCTGSGGEKTERR